MVQALFKTIDGTVFTDAEVAAQYEATIDTARAVSDALNSECFNSVSERRSFLKTLFANGSVIRGLLNDLKINDAELTDKQLCAAIPGDAEPAPETSKRREEPKPVSKVLRDGEPVKKAATHVNIIGARCYPCGIKFNVEALVSEVYDSSFRSAYISLEDYSALRGCVVKIFDPNEAFSSEELKPATLALLNKWPVNAVLVGAEDALDTNEFYMIEAQFIEEIPEEDDEEDDE